MYQKLFQKKKKKSSNVTSKPARQGEGHVGGGAGGSRSGGAGEGLPECSPTARDLDA